jgi:hypothetical protein
VENYVRYFDELKGEMRVKLNTLKGYPIGNKNFKKNDFQFLASEIEKKLQPLKTQKIIAIGKTISWEVIRQILNYSFVVSVPLNKKVEKTLSKICIYLGYNDWVNFVTRKAGKNDSEARTVALVKRHFQDTIEKVNEYFINLPEIKKEDLYLYFYPLLAERFYRLLVEKKSENFTSTLNIPKLAVTDVKVIQLAPTYAQVYAIEHREQILLEELKNHVRTTEHNEDTECIYSLTFSNGRWLIYSRSTLIDEDLVSPFFSKHAWGTYYFDDKP